MHVCLLGRVAAKVSGSRSIAPQVLIVSVALVSMAFGQEIRGTIAGTVTDPQGAAVSGARVEIRGIDTNVVYPATTNDSGIYVLPLLPAGNYSISVTKEGFKRAQEQRVELRVSERAQVDFHLEVGAVSQQVLVTSEAPLLETATASRDQVVSDKAVADLPYEGRNSFLTSAITSGFYFGSTDSLNAIRPFDNGGMDSMQINGGLGFRNNFTINGLPDTAQESANPASLTYVPPPDAVKEVSVESNAYDAQYGHTGGGTINVDLKSGTNQFHGAVYEYVRNTIFNANRWENNASGAARTPYHWSEPGIELDGPVYIPHLYNGKDKTFFMFSWERIQDGVPQPLTASVPTLQQLTGDFSATTSGGKPVTIYDPLTTSQTSPGVYTRTAFPGNIIPANRINPVGAKLISYYPKPNAAGTLDHLNNYFDGATVVTDKYDVFSYTVDQSINEKNRMSFSYFQANRHQVEPTYDFGSPAASPLYTHYRVNHGGSINWTSTLNPTTVLDIRDGFERHNFAVV
ncbi:MAG: TonB-dependent receptor, partial [Bryobacteraceae bacterium]